VSDPVAPAAPGTLACPRCASPVARDQDWCLVCGAAARTRLAPAPNWKLPVTIVAGVVAVCLVAFALAFVALTDDPAPATGATGATGTSGPTVVAPAPAPAPPPAPPPAAATGPTGATGTAPPPTRPPGAGGTTG